MKKFWIIAALSLALATTWLESQAWMHQTAWDVISYMDLGEALVKGDFKTALNSYWSPLWPLVMALSLPPLQSLFSVSELTALSWLVVASVVFAVFCFILFYKQLSTFVESTKGEDEDKISTLAEIGCYVSFVYNFVALGAISAKTPDVLAGALALLVNLLWLKLASGKRSYINCLLLGLFMGLSYLAKHYLLFWSILLIVCLWIKQRAYQLNWRHLAAITAAFATTSLLWIIPVSINVGHFTTNDTMKVGHAWLPLLRSQDQLHARGPTFKHPTRIFFDKPRVYEFATPFAVTYPPWYAPAYWYEGVPFPGIPAHYIPLLQPKWDQYCLFFFIPWGLALLIISLANRGLPLSLRRLNQLIPALVPNLICLLLLFLLSDPSGRYYIPYSTAIFCALFVSLKLKNRQAAAGAGVLIAYMVIASLLVFALHTYFASPTVANMMRRLAPVGLPESPPYAPHEPTAALLSQLGIKPGDKVARITRLHGGQFHWAKLARVKIVAECVDPDGFNAASPEQRQELYKKLRQLGAKAIVQDWFLDQPTYIPCREAGWMQVPGTQNWVLKL